MSKRTERLLESNLQLSVVLHFYRKFETHLNVVDMVTIPTSVEEATNR